MSDKEDKLPATIKKWEHEREKLGLTDQTIHGVELASASKFEYKQFLLLRVLWKIHSKPETVLKMLPGIDDWISKANAMLKGYKSWDTYSRGFMGSRTEEGTFAIARYYQLEVANTDDKADPLTLTTPIAHRLHPRQAHKRSDNSHLETPSKSTNISKTLDIENIEDYDSPDIPQTPSPATPSPYRAETPVPRELENVLYPPTKDEQIVNCALVLLLNALTIHFNLVNKWTLHRKAFKAQFAQAGFEARTDGYLGYTLDKQDYAKVIIEVKPVRRYKKIQSIQMQESAQMVAWIKDDNEKKIQLGPGIRRVVISQDRHEIYLTIAEYDDDYVKYLSDENYNGTPFMIMHQFGPWDTLNANNMKFFGPLLLAISLQAEETKA